MTSNHGHPNLEDSARTADRLIAWIKENGPARIDSSLIDQQQCIPPSVVMDLAATGMLGMIVPPRYGGLGLQHRDVIRVLAQLAAVDLNVAIFVLDGVMAAHAILGTAEDSIRQEILPDLAQGRIICAFAVTEPAAGSNPRAMTMTASPDSHDGWRLNGAKAWVGSGSWASHILLWAQTHDAFGNPLGVSGFVVRRDAGGINVGPQAQMLGLRGVPKNTVHFDGTPVTKREVLGEVGQGMEAVQTTMSYTRLCLAAMTAGVMKRSVALMSGYAGRRSISTGLLAENPVTLAKLSEIHGAIFAVEALCADLAVRYDRAEAVPTELTAIAKVFGSEYLGRAADTLIQMLGARGYEEPNIAPRILRDSRAFRLFEGPTETLGMHIGASAVHSASDLYGYLHDGLGDTAAAERLGDIAGAIHRNVLAGSGTDDAKISWAYALAGDAASAIIVESALRRSNDLDHVTVPAPALSWARAWCEDSIARSLEVSTRDLPVAGEVQTMLDTLEEGIGRQRWDYPGVEQRADSLVSGEAAPAPVGEPGWAEQERFPWNRPVVPPPDEAHLHELIEASARRHPGKTALRWAGQAMSYRQLDERATAIAGELGRRGITTEDLVGVGLPRGFDQIAAILGVLKAGACYLPVDPAQPVRHLAGILDNANPALVITESGYEHVLGAHASKAVFLDRIKDEDKFVLPATTRLGSPRAAAYVIYTSGSTGAPKGVVIEHQAAVNFVRSAVRRYGLAPGDCMVQFASPAFDAAIEEIFCCLAVGGTLVLRAEEVPDPALLLAMCQEQQVTVLDLPTAYWHELTRAVAAGSMSLPAALRTVIIGGERPDPGIFMSWREAVGTYPELVNTYGPTEATVVAAVCSLADIPFRDSEPHEFPLGRPLDNVTLHVLNERMHPIGPGEVGELYIGGAGLARGYLNDPELTETRFRSLPVTGERVYRTGDLARWGEDGSLEFAGRIDDQVKIRGFRIEPGAIATVFAMHPAVRESFIMPQEDGTGQLRLLAYLTPEDGAQITVEQMHQHAAEHLPIYMHPGAYVVLDQLPRGASHKIDRKRLPKPEVAEPSAQPHTELEETMGRIWSEILGTQPGPDDHFLAVGGHSLSAMRLIAKVRETLGITLPASAIFKHGTIAGLCRHLEETGQAPTPQPESKDVAIIGGGPAGIAAFLHLVYGENIRSIRIIDPNPVGDGGSAFGPDATPFITNTSAQNMSLFSDAPEDFVEYLRSTGRSAGREAFVPRSWFGEYCRARYQEHLELARARRIEVEHIAATVTALTPHGDRAGYDVVLETGVSTFATHVIIATGPSDRKVGIGLAAYQDHPRLLASPYPVRSVRERIGDDPARILVIGTGQSAVDIALHLCESGHRVTLTSVSGIVPSVRTRTGRTARELRARDRLRAVLASGAALDLDLLERTVTDILGGISRVPLSEQVSTLTDPAARMRAEIRLAEQDLNTWQDLVVEAVEEVARWTEEVPPAVAGPVLYQCKWVLRRYGDAIPLPNARRLVAAIDAEQLEIRTTYPEDISFEGVEWCVTWDDGISRFDYIVQATGHEIPALGATPSGYQLAALNTQDRVTADFDGQRRVQNPFTGRSEDIWAIGVAARSRSPLAVPILIAARHAAETAGTILGAETIEVISI